MAFVIEDNPHSLAELSKASLSAMSTSNYHRPHCTVNTTADEPNIRHRGIFEFLFRHQSLNFSPASGLPSAAECAVHLELLETFYVLRQRILRSETFDKVYGIEPKHETVKRYGEDVRLKDKTLWDRRQVKWRKFLEVAVVRFLVWWRKVHLVLGQGRQEVRALAITQETLPPLDVIMVWHSFLLNPRDFKQRCQHTPIYKISFPWASIHQTINNHDWTFILNSQAANTYKEVTGLESDLSEDMSAWKDLPLASLSHLRQLSLEGYSPAQTDLQTLEPKTERILQAFRSVDKTLAVWLRDAVIRQSSFVDKMNGRLWIRSPALNGTLTRALGRYERFLKLIKLYRNSMFVPTLDIDLVWHTHQCSPRQYIIDTMQLAGKFLNHDDSIAEDKLDDGFENTQNLFRVHFGKNYQICGCWDCEALLSVLEEFEGGAKLQPDLDEITKKVKSDVKYYRAVELARRNKKPLPIRHEGNSED